MAHTETISLSWKAALAAKLKDYAQLVKLRLALTVVFSAVIGFMLGLSSTAYWLDIVMIIAGGFLITGASNAINEIIEKDSDKLMTRTAKRPLAADRMKVSEAILASGVMGVGGISILAFYFNPLAGLLAAIALLSYGFIYTPLKKVSPIAVFVGAIPGALPPLIGFVSASGGAINELAVTLFAIQFLWQFPHFWAIGWLAFDDYKKAGIMLLPSRNGKTRYVAALSILYIVFMLLVGVLPYFMGYVGWAGTLVMTFAGISFLIRAYNLYKNQDDQSAKKLMLGSVMYLTVAMLAMVIDKV